MTKTPKTPNIIKEKVNKPASRSRSKSPKAKIVEASKAEASQTSNDSPQLGNNAEQCLDPQQLKSIEMLSVNMAKAAMTAQTAFASNLFKKNEADAPSPDPFDVAPAISQVMGSLFTHPEKLMKAQTDLFTGYVGLWGKMAQQSLEAAASISTSKNESSTQKASPKGDKRFSDPSWSENPMFTAIKESYLLTSSWLNNLVSQAEGIDPQDKRRAEFYIKLLTDAFSPSNYLFSNPAALKALIETKGESLVKGMEQFANDLARGDGKLMISQADYDRFKVGENMATSAGKVIYRSRLFELLQYAPTTETVYETPLLIFPPWINKFYILDLQPKNSLIKWLTEQGFSVFLVSWVNPDVSMKDTTFEDYMFEGIYDAIKQVKIQCAVDKVNTVGYCIGGTLLGCAMGHMAAKKDESINSATFFTAQHDFSEAGDLMIFTTETWIKELERRMDVAGGVLPGADMADTFNLLRANDLIWSFYVNNYLLGKDLAPFDLLCWNSDQTRMAKAVHIFYLKMFYLNNALAKGELVLGGEKIDLKKVKTPIYEQSGREDHIAPAASVYRGSKLFGGPVTFVLAGSGHIAGVVNHPSAKKYQHWLNDEYPATLEQWQKGAQEHPGSWWPHWAQWLKEKSGDLVPARDPSLGHIKPLMDAPGSYVLVKS